MSIKYYYIRVGLQTRDAFFGNIKRIHLRSSSLMDDFPAKVLLEAEKRYANKLARENVDKLSIFSGWHTSLANPRYHYTLRGYNHLGWMAATIKMEAANQGMVYTYHPPDWNWWMGDVRWIMHKHNDNYVLCCCAHVFHLKSTVAPERSQKTAISFNRHELRGDVKTWLSLNCCLDLSNDSNYHRLKAVDQNLCSLVKNMSTRIGDFDLGSVQCLSSVFDRVPPTANSGFRQTKSPPDGACLEVTEYHYGRKDDVAEALGDLNMQGRDQTRGLGIAEELGALREGIGLGDMPGGTNESWRVHLKKICVDVRYKRLKAPLARQRAKRYLQTLPQLRKSELPLLPPLDWLVPRRKETDKDYPHLNMLLLKEDEESNLNGLGYDESLQPLKPPSKARSCSTEISSLIPRAMPKLDITEVHGFPQGYANATCAGGSWAGAGRTLGGRWAGSWAGTGCGAGRTLGARWVLPW
ncbi:hypothetical protein IW261DRAFT_1412971 [Armillaria novae-zelandiae]|uniref:Uncharacterized protein n=1 Tax=Armillaria novae-zelandiae TaxID=153914 RepID=A0AA39PTV7_9AGAR|nr:hypothetical protein IW261DRAFT_1412971 [Armillaria novae-zelandiae]